MKEQIKTDIDKLSTLILENSGVHREYSDKDLLNATIIFTEVFLAKMWDKHEGKLSQEQMEQLAEEAGTSIHQTIKVFTGVDMKKVYDK